MNISARIKEFREFKRLSITDFAKKINATKQVVSNIEKEVNNPSYELIVKILSAFDDINCNWLILGEGEMLVSNTISTTINGGISQIGNINGQGGKNTMGASATIDSDKDKEIATLRQKIELQEQLILSLQENITLLRQMLNK